MGMKKSAFLIPALSLLLVFSCADDPPPQSPPPRAPSQPQAQQKPAEPVQPVVVFDPKSVTKEEFDTTKTEVQQFIQKLNGIIRAKDYDNWITYLGPDYFAIINSKEYLDRINKSERMVKSNRTLYSARDYFTYVVVPSRANDRVDDIEFVSQNRVKAYTINPKGDRLRLYDLEKTRSGWKIIN
jgi:hypothetical protein